MTEKDYTDFISSIDNSIAGEDDFGSLSWHVDCSATENMETPNDWAGAIETAKMCLDAWQDFYPQLVK